MKFTVLVCTYNRPQLLEMSLEALSKCAEKPDEVVIVNGGDEEADAVVRKYENRFTSVKTIKTRNINLAVSRNVGLPHCTGDIIAMTDDDAQVFPDWITWMKQAHRDHPEAGAVGGKVLGVNNEKLIARIADSVTFPSSDEPTYVRTLPGVNVSYKKTVVEQIGLQDEALFRGEDVDWNWRVLQSGYKIFYDPAIKVYHQHRPTLGTFFHQHYMYGRAYCLVRRKWKEMYSVYPHGIHQPRDVLKLGYFFVSTFYEPLLAGAKMRSPGDKLLGYPILVANQLFWKSGMVIQALKGWTNSSTRQDNKGK